MVIKIIKVVFFFNLIEQRGVRKYQNERNIFFFSMKGQRARSGSKMFAITFMIKEGCEVNDS